METARSAELQANEERNRLREQERSLDNYRWKLKEMEEDLVARAEHLDRLMQVVIYWTNTVYYKTKCPKNETFKILMFIL